MRMRKKKNLTNRVKQSKRLLCPRTDDMNFDTSANRKDYIDLHELFGNDNPTEMEIGCGKGRFICELAARNPNINYIAVEKSANVIVDACKKIEDAGLSNVYFISCCAEYLPKFIREKTIGRLYLNFSCPFPKNSYETHRLTSGRFLEMYKQLLCDGAEIYQKTDNQSFFEYSIEQFSEHGYTLKNISLDLHKSDFEGNIVTEYEKRFSDLGQPIYRLEAYIKRGEAL